MSRCDYSFELGDGAGGVHRRVCMREAGHEKPHDMKLESTRPDERWNFRKQLEAWAKETGQIKP